LKILKYAQLVKDTRDSKWIFYSIDDENFFMHTKVLEEFFTSIQENLQKGVQASPIRTSPCLCDELQKKADHKGAEITERSLFEHERA
jgi:ArsR family transcriptional regulator